MRESARGRDGHLADASGRPCSGWPICCATTWPRWPGRTTGSASGEIPGGEAGYLAAVARHTTTTLSPEDIHAIGLAELDELASLWSEIGQEALGESEFAVIAARMRDDPALRFRTREEIIATAQDALDRAEAARGTYFEPYDIPGLRHRGDQPGRRRQQRAWPTTGPRPPTAAAPARTAC